MKLKPSDKKALQDLQHSVLIEASFMTVDKLKEHMKTGTKAVHDFCMGLKLNDTIFDFKIDSEYAQWGSRIDIYIKLDESSEYVLYSREMRGKQST